MATAAKTGEAGTQMALMMMTTMNLTMIAMPGQPVVSDGEPVSWKLRWQEAAEGRESSVA
jgi:hypothetical protein